LSAAELVAFARLCRTVAVRDALRRAMGGVRAGGPQRDAGRVLVLFDRGRRVVVRLCALYTRSCFHHRSRPRLVRLFAQSPLRFSRAKGRVGIIILSRGRSYPPPQAGRVREGASDKIPIDYCSRRVLILRMSIERSALPLGDDRAETRPGGEYL